MQSHSARNRSTPKQASHTIVTHSRIPAPLVIDGALASVSTMPAIPPIRFDADFADSKRRPCSIVPVLTGTAMAVPIGTAVAVGTAVPVLTMAVGDGVGGSVSLRGGSLNPVGGVGVGGGSVEPAIHTAIEWL